MPTNYKFQLKNFFHYNFLYGALNPLLHFSFTLVFLFFFLSKLFIYALKPYMRLTCKQNISRFLEQVIELLTSYQDCKPKCMQVFLKHIRFCCCCWRNQQTLTTFKTVVTTWTCWQLKYDKHKLAIVAS